MIKLFDVLTSILEKKNQEINKNPDFVQAVSTNYMLQRWLTMTNGTIASILNDTTNKVWRGLCDDRQMWYKILNVLVPKTKTKPVYMKKANHTVNKEKEKALELMAKRFELSTRELSDSHRLFGFDIGSYKEAGHDNE